MTFLNEVLIRKASIYDLDDLYQIEVECFSSDAYTRNLIEYFLRTPSFLIFIARDNEKTVGFVVGSVERKGSIRIGHVYTLDVRRNYRRRGIALKLMNELERSLLRNGVNACYLEVGIDNTPAQELYRKMNYKPIKMLYNYYGKERHAVLFFKILDEKKRLRII